MRRACFFGVTTIELSLCVTVSFINELDTLLHPAGEIQAEERLALTPLRESTRGRAVS